MQDRRKSGALATLLGSPWWIGVALALFAYLFMRFGFAWLMPPGQTTQAVAQGMADIAWVFALPFLVAAAVSLLRMLFRGRMHKRRGSLVALRVLPRHRFELLAGEAFGRQGYIVEARGSRTPDGEVDLELWREGRKSIVVCRNWQMPQAGIAQIRELNDIMRFEHADEAIYLSSGQYTHEAWQYAQGKPVRLIDGEGLLQLLAGVWDLPQADVSHIQARIEPRIHEARQDH